MYKISGGKFTYDVIAEFGVSNLNLKKKNHAAMMEKILGCKNPK